MSRFIIDVIKKNFCFKIGKPALDIVLEYSTKIRRSLIWDKLFKSGLSKFFGRQPLKNLLSPLLNTLSHIESLLKKSFFLDLEDDCGEHS